jgi:hypothetical protein
MELGETLQTPRRREIVIGKCKLPCLPSTTDLGESAAAERFGQIDEARVKTPSFMAEVAFSTGVGRWRDVLVGDSASTCIGHVFF